MKKGNLMKRIMIGKRIRLIVCLLAAAGVLCMTGGVKAYAAGSTGITPGVTGQRENRTNINEPGSAGSGDALRELNVANELTVTFNNGEGGMASTLKILITLTAIGLAPIMLLLLTSYTRIIIVLHFTRTALNTQSSPPNQVLIALALFLTVFIMSPVLMQINTEAIQPFEKNEITQEEALTRGLAPLREFMYKQTETKDVRMFLEIAGIDKVEGLEDIPTTVLIPSFVVGELRIAFIIGFLIYIPFIVIDMVVASTLMSMGMMMLPPTTISMPFKILLFVLADGWNLIIGNLVKTFY